MDVKTFIGNYIEGLPEATETEIKNGVLMVRTDAGEMKKVDSSNLGSSEIYYATYDVTTYDDITAAKNDGKLVVVVSPERGGTTYVVLTQYSSFCAGQFTYETENSATVVTYKVSASGWERSVKPLAGASQVEALEALVPDAASEDNQLTDKSYVDNQVNQVAAKYLSQDEDGNPFDTYELFEAAQESGDFYYAGAVTTPTKNDYVLVSSDSQHDNKVTRYWYTGNSWSFQYVVNNTPFTDAEWDAIRSGITAEKVAEFEDKLDAVSHDDTISGDGTEENPLSVNEMEGASEEETSVTIGGRVYPVVKIGNQLWITENLDYKFSGLTVGQSGTSTTEPRANYYNNDEDTYGANGNKYGLLYNWIAVKYLNDNRSALIPEGWHVPSGGDWDALVTAIGGRAIAGTKLKSTTGWSGSNGTDDYGFSVFPAGLYNGSFFNVNHYSSFWTSSEYSSSSAYYTGFSTNAVDFNNSNKDGQCSVRLVKNITSGSYDGKKGLVPQPKAEDINKVLSGAGTWVGLPNKTSQLENDSGLVELPKDGSSDKMILSDGSWNTVGLIDKQVIDDELYWGETLQIGDMEYKIATMPDGRVWMTENLAEVVAGAYYLDAEYKEKYGCLYTYNDAKSIADSVDGWHIPTRNEILALFNTMGGEYECGRKLVSTEFGGSDDCGFSFPLAGACRTSYGNRVFEGFDSNAVLLSSTPYPNYESTATYGYNFQRNSVHVPYGLRSNASNWSSVRLIKDA